jgi:rare lipoprotein A (peptidoglycan hydrolase)
MTKPTFTRFLATALVLLVSMSTTVTASEVAQVRTGIASWYGGSWIGKLTANGERYGAADMTAAHKTLPFGTMVRVTNLSNLRSTVVRINNRGPYVKGRMIDLSKRAAVAIGMIGSGTARVKLEVVPREEKRLAGAALKLEVPTIAKGSLDVRLALAVQPAAQGLFAVE